VNAPLGVRASGRDTVIDRGALVGWCALAIASLALAGVFALLLAMSRTPVIQDLIPWPNNFFQKGLVAHVVLSFVVWYLAVFGALMDPMGTAAPRRVALGRTGLALAALGTLVLLVPTFSARGEPTLNNYIPAIIDPLYYGGLAALGIGVALAAGGYLIGGGISIRRDGPGLLVNAAAIVYLCACVGFAVTFLKLIGTPPSFEFNETLMWGGGHMLQFVNLALMLAAWAILGERATGRPLVGGPAAGLAGAIAAAAGTLGLVILAVTPIGGNGFTQWFTDLQYALALPVAVFAAAATSAIRAHGIAPANWRDPAFLCLALSAAVFTLGAALGLFVDGADTRTPAHYHGVIGGINLAFMGLFHVRFLPALGRSMGAGWFKAQITLYAVGQSLFVVGMYWAGTLGAARKVAESSADVTTSGEFLARALTGVGGAIAVIGGVIFVWSAAAALLRKPDPK
jgi:heme/copper-type cytochrome/quinol oxidase subunit 1